MFVRKRFKKRHQKSQNAIKALMKHHSKPIYLLATILLIVSASLIFSTVLSTFPETSASTEPNVAMPSETTIRSKPQFNVDVIYAYAGENNYGSEELHSTFNGVPMHPVSLYPVTVYLNLTHVSNAETEACDAEIEVYLIEVSSDKGPKESYTCFFGTNYDTTFSDTNVLTPAINQINNLIGTQPINGLTGLFNPNMDTNQSLWFKVGSLDSTTSEPSGLGLWSAGEPNAITVSVHRIGWIALNGTVTSTTLASPEDTVQVSLAKSGEGFLYNKIPQDKMSQKDAFHPIDLLKPLT
jgi:hypothetical protein